MVKNLSLCLIVKNEEVNIQDCIESFKSIVGEIIVLDTGSIDKTKTLAHENGASVFDFEWKGSFAEARNKCLEYVKTDWCIFVDADERLEKWNHECLLRVMAQGDIISVNVKTSNENIEKVKLWKVNKGYKYVLPVHEFLNVSNQKIHFLESLVVKNKSFMQSNKLFESRKKYIETLELYIEDTDDYIDRCYFYLCADSFFVEDYERSYQYGTKYISLNMPRSYFLGKIYYYMSEIELMNGNAIIAKKYIEKAYDILGELKILHEVYSHILYTMGDVKESVKYFKKLNE